MANAATVDSPARSQIRILSGINLVLGAWLIMVPFLFGAPAAALWNDVVVGALVLALAGVRVSKPTSGTKSASWINAAIGLWLIVAPFVLGYGTGGPMWNDVIVGVLILAFGACSAYLLGAGSVAEANRTAGSGRTNRPKR